MPSLSNPGGGGGYDYVQSGAPDSPQEGETWYDTSNNEGKVYTGSTWVLHTVDDHSELAGVGSSDHHTRPTGTQSEGPYGGWISPDTTDYTAANSNIVNGNTGDGDYVDSAAVEANESQDSVRFYPLGDCTGTVEALENQNNVLWSTSFSATGGTFNEYNLGAMANQVRIVFDSTQDLMEVETHVVRMPQHTHSV